MSNFTFSGWATKYNVLCDDGRTIRDPAFKNQHGQKVPIVYRHNHDDLDAIVGHGTLVYVPGQGIRLEEAKLNTTPNGQLATTQIQHGDISSLSIWANKLYEVGADLVDGFIREVSLVLSGQNPGAKIDNVLAHSAEEWILDGGTVDRGVIIHPGDSEIEINITDSLGHAATTAYNKDQTIGDILKSFNKEQKLLAMYIIQAMVDGEDSNTDMTDKETVSHESTDDDEATLTKEEAEKIFSTLTEEQINVLGYIIDVLNDDEVGHDAVSADSDDSVVLTDEKETILEKESITMYTNIFEQNNSQTAETSEARESARTIIHDAMKANVPSVRGALAHSGVDYGITSATIDLLFPNARLVNPGAPQMITNEQGWINVLMGAVNATPFSSVKNRYADLTVEEARALGYITGTEKIDSFWNVYGRETTSQTVYIKMRMDRDDVVDITDFNVLAWIKQGMTLLHREAIARGFLIGDGRASNHPQKIKPGNIRPVYGDDALYSVPVVHEAADTVLDIIDGFVGSMPLYKGRGGNKIFFCTPEFYASAMILRDSNGHRYHKTNSELAAALGVSMVVPVAPMSGLSRTVDVTVHNLLGIMLDPADYNVGTNAGGEQTFFSDFDLNFNQNIYLLESRLSGALVTPKSALVVEQKAA